MLMKAFENHRISFRKRIQLRLAAGIAIMLCGIAIFVFSMVMEDISGIHSFNIGFYCGFGGGFFGAGIATALQCLHFLRDKQRLKAQELKETDERNIFVAARAAQAAFYVALSIVLVAVLITGLIPAAQVIFSTLLIVLLLMFVAWLITYIVCNKLY